MSTRAILYVLADFFTQALTKIQRIRFYHMQFSCQRNSDLIHLLRRLVIGREDGNFACEAVPTMHTVAAKLIFSRN